MKQTLTMILVHALVAMFNLSLAEAQVGSFTKAQVADRIRKVEDGVDEFQKYLESRGEDARSTAQSAQASGTTSRRRQGRFLKYTSPPRSGKTDEG